MEMPDDVFERMLERMKEIQFTLRDMRAELWKWRQEPDQPTAGSQMDGVEPPTDKQLQFLRGLGVEEMPSSKVEARRMLQELNLKREAGEYSIPPTAKQLKYLQDLNYTGEIPQSREEAWKLIQELRGTE